MQEIDNSEVLQILTSRHELDENTIIPIGHGVWASGYSYEQSGQKYIIRLSDTRENFDRDALAHDYTSPRLPIPQILEIGESRQGFYAISKFVEGDFFENLTANELVEFSPELIKMFQSLRKIDLVGKEGYGHWGANGNGESEGWGNFLLSANQDKQNSLIHGWKNNLRESPLGTDSFNQLYEKLQTYTQYCPDERKLIHSDLLNFNFIVRDNRPVAVLDWGSSIYGDSLYEIAWFLFYEKWYPSFVEGKLVNLLLENYKNTTDNIENIPERLLAYQLHIGLDSIAYNSFKKDWKHTQEAADHTMKITL